MLPDDRDLAKQMIAYIRSDLSEIDEILAQVDCSQNDMLAMQNRAKSIRVNAFDLVNTLPKPQ